MYAFEYYEDIIIKHYQTLRPSEKKVADYILRNPSDIPSISLAQLSHMVSVSDPTVMRFLRSIGFLSFSEFKVHLATNLGSRAQQMEDELLVDLHISKEDLLTDIPQKIIAQTIQSLKGTLQLVNVDTFQQAITYITTSNMIDIYGVGNSTSVALDMVNKFSRIGLKCRCTLDNHLQQINAAHLTSKDLAIVISHSGSTIDTVDTLKLAKMAGAKTIAITNFRATALPNFSDLCLFTGDVETSFYTETMFSRTSQLAYVDMLYTGVILSNYAYYAKQLDKINHIVKNKNYP